MSRYSIPFLKRNRGGKNKYQQLKNVMAKLLLKVTLQLDTKNTRYLGAGLAFSGRAYGAKRAGSFKLLTGAVPFNRFDT